MQAALGSRYQLVCSNHRRPVFACRHHQKTSIKLTFVSTEEVHPEKVIGLLLDIIEVKRANVCPHIRALIGFFLETGVRLLVASEKI